VVLEIKIIVFGWLKRGDKVYTQIIEKCDSKTLQAIIKDKVSTDSVINSDDKEITKPKKIATAIRKVFPLDQGYEYTLKPFSLIDEFSMSKDSNIELFSINFNKPVDDHKATNYPNIN
jgi:outer membrane protein assembly factor BamA